MAGGPITMTRGDRVRALRVLVPVAVAVAIALMPPPPGLAPHAWHYVAIFAATVAALVLEPVPSPAVGLIAVAAVAVLAPRGAVRPERAGASVRCSARSFSQPCSWRPA